MLDVLLQGFPIVFQLHNLLAILFGVFIGQVLGILPGIGPAAGMALLIPMTYGVEPVTATVMLAGIMYGGMYGGALTSVLINVPGEASSLMTAVEGNQLAKQGLAGKALSTSAIASFLGGTISIFGLIIMATALSAVALKFSVPEFFLLALLGITMTASLGTASPLKAFIAAAIGLMIACVGIDPLAGVPRLTFGSSDLLEGFDFLPVAIGLFGVAEVLSSLERFHHEVPLRTRLRDLWFSWDDWKQTRGAITRGEIIGFLLGVLPGIGPTVASMMSYVAERKFSRNPERFGHGSLSGLAATESANNSSVNGCMVPMLAFGIPGSTGTAVMMAALVVVGIRPGSMMTDNTDIVAALFASMFVGNLMLLIMNLPLAPVFAMLLRLRYAYLAPAILVVSMLGTYSVGLDVFSVVVSLGAGMLGYLMMKANIPRAPLILAVVLASLLENSLRQSLMLAEGSPIIFVQRPIAAFLLVVVILSVVLPIVSEIRGRRLLRNIAAQAAAAEGVPR